MVDEGVTPRPEGVADYDRTAVGESREVNGPIRIKQPLGPGFQIGGPRVRFFNFRLDLDVDGLDNSVQIDRLRTVTLPQDH